MKWAIDGKNAKNIALSGPYGAGKSSVIDTFLKKNRAIKKRSIKISMATFVEEALNKDGNLEKQSIELQKDEIEKGILKQLFYKVDYRKIPQSRYRKLHRITFGNVFISTLLLILACFIVSYVFWPSALVYAFEKIIEAGAKINLSKTGSLTLSGVFVLGCLVAISMAYRTVISRLTVKEIKLPKDISFQKNHENQESIFNKNMDEIIYFFEETKYNIVFFEDFDRLNKTSVFVHLRELNTILNNYDAIRKPIVFVYAVKDDIFTEADRTKFFDFIIPIVPIINSTNSGEILLDKLEASKNINKIHNISESFVMDVSPYISDMRILQNIYNEFIIYKSTLATEQKLTLLDETMLAMIIFKNLSPRDFAELQNESGIVKQAFKDKKEFISKKCNEIQARITESTEVLDKIKTEIFTSKKSLKYSFLCEITGGMGSARNFKPKGKETVNSANFLKDDFAIPDWFGINTCSVNYINWDGYNKYDYSYQAFDEVYNKLVHRYKAISLIEDDKIEEEKKHVEAMKQQIYELSSRSLSELIDLYGINEVLSDNVTSNKLLVFLLRRGYIDEKYVNYINYFKATTITTDDMNYILAVKNLSSKPYNYALTRTDLVINRLQPYEFEQEVIYNFDLLDCLLSTTEYDEKLNLYIKQLSNGSETSWKFIDEFIDITKYKQHFISILANNWSTMWDNIFNNPFLTLERKFYYLSLLISHNSIDVIKSMDANGNLNRFFVSNSDVLHRLSFVIEDDKIIEVITSLKIKFEDIQIENVSTCILDYIFDNNYYCINFEMIQHIVEYKNKELVPFLTTQNYSTLLKVNYAPLLKYVENNIDIYTDNIVLLENNTEEDISAVIKLLELNANDNCRGVQIINNENIYVEDITMICLYMREKHEEYVNSLWNTIIADEKLKPTWQNLNLYWHYLGHTDISINYMCKNVDELTKDDSTCIDDESFIEEFIKCDIDKDSFAKLLPKLAWSDFNIALDTLDEWKVSIMIAQRYFEFDAERYNELSETFPNLCTEFIIQNQDEYISIHDEIDMNSSLLESLVLDKRFYRSNAQRLIEVYGSKYMSCRIAHNLKSLEIDTNIAIFKDAWKLLGTDSREKLMIEYLYLLEADDFENCFSELGEEYVELADRSRRHEVSLLDSKTNLELVKRLKAIDYITSFQKKQCKIEDDSETDSTNVSKIICRIKISNK